MSMEEKEGIFKIPIQKHLVSQSKRQELIVRFSWTQTPIVSVCLIEIMGPSVCVCTLLIVVLFILLTASGIKRSMPSEVSLILIHISETLILE